MPIVTERFDELLPAESIVGVYIGPTDLVAEGAYEDDYFREHALAEVQVVTDASDAKEMIQDIQLQAWAAIEEEDGEVRWHPVRYVSGE